ncbi:Mediator of RNA polymerase II transcription subunit 25 [Nymphaea thermarum]|nr:Mediator of RNA polymerase II transcription subunit 25 [Nymphaea thermarum]
MQEKQQLIVVVEGTAAMGPFWNIILSDYLDKIVRYFHGNELTGQKISSGNVELALVVFHAHGPYAACLVQRSGWTRDLDVFMNWLSSITFTGGGFSESAVCEGLAEALMMFHSANLNQLPQAVEIQKHCILIAASNPHPLPTPVSLPTTQELEQKENSEVKAEGRLCDAEAVAKAFVQCHASLSVVSPKQLPKLKAIYNVAKRSSRVAEAAVDNSKNPQFLLLLSDSFVEARAALSRSGVAGLTSNQNQPKFDTTNVPTTMISAPPATSISSVHVPAMNRAPITGGLIPPAIVKVEPNTSSSLGPGPTYPHVKPAIPHVASPVSSMQVSSPAVTSQEQTTSADNAQELKPIVGGISQGMRSVGSAAANVNILNNLSQVHKVMTSASLTGPSSMGIPTLGGTLMAMHMSSMLSNGMSSAPAAPAQNVFQTTQSVMASMAGATTLGGTAQVSQNVSQGSLPSAPSNLPGNTSIGSPPLANMPGVVGMNLPASVGGHGNLSSGTQIGPGAIGMSQTVMGGSGTTSLSSGAGTMIPTPGLSQPGVHSLGVNNNSSVNMAMTQSSAAMQQQSKYVKIWEGALSGQRQGQPVHICKLEGYRHVNSSESLASDWKPTMQIVRLISSDYMNNKQYLGKCDYLVFRVLNQHGFLSQLQEKKLCAVIQLPSQTLLLSVSDKPSRLIGMLFPGDMVVFKPQPSSQQQQQQQLQQQSQQQQQLQQQPQQLQPQQSQQLQHQQQLQQHQQQQQLQQHQQQQQQIQQHQQMQQHQQQQQQMQQHQQQLQHQQQQIQQHQQQQQLQQHQQQQQLQHQQQQLQQHQQQQQLQHQQQQQQQMVPTAMNQAFVQGQGRTQMLSQGQMLSQAPQNMPGGGFLS